MFKCFELISLVVLCIDISIIKANSRTGNGEQLGVININLFKQILNFFEEYECEEMDVSGLTHATHLFTDTNHNPIIRGNTSFFRGFKLDKKDKTNDIFEDETKLIFVFYPSSVEQDKYYIERILCTSKILKNRVFKALTNPTADFMMPKKSVYDTYCQNVLIAKWTRAMMLIPVKYDQIETPEEMFSITSNLVKTMIYRHFKKFFKNINLENFYDAPAINDD